jgi:hypothetical protein
MKTINLLLLFILVSCSRSIIDTTLKLGTGSPSNTVIESNQGAVNNPQLLYDFTSGKWRLSNDGVAFSDLSSADSLTSTLVDYVALATNQTISGAKIFSSDLSVTGQFVVTSTVNGSHPAPSMSTPEKLTITGAVEGDMVYDYDLSAFFFYDELGAWKEMGSGSGGSGGAGLPLLSKGAFLTSDGTTNGELICADGEIAEWDSAEAAGVKCVTTPISGGGGTDLAIPAHAKSWNIETNILFNANWSKFAFSGASTYVAVSRANSPNGTRIARSTDGVNWTAIVAPVLFDWSDVDFGNGIWVISATATSQFLYSYDDGLTWSLSNTFTSGNYTSVTYGNGRFVAVSSNSARSMISFDGISWTEGTDGDLTIHFLQDVEYYAGKFIGLTGVTGEGAILLSTDGLNWDVAIAPYSYKYSLAYGNGVMVVGLASLTSTGNNSIIYSIDDGITWREASTQDAANYTGSAYRSVVFADGRFWAFSNGTAITSIDGISWAGMSTSVQVNNVRDALYDGTKLIILNGLSNNYIIYSGPLI